ncbi:nitrate reductase [Candidatus Sulfurimonas marisnigri]|uniref:Nitrate reductase n=1 Tax=Candidatus Sulfurimonas marisnigri TaxID=2740405 RepID=A0A7S7RR91_9BACT|nr:WD40 repeat domain-containing protein [Candidatus Sulfurimonas marisnigri]QOY55290.1 nitrate reductase [Candidatus Sulfurimonas marisnigri]
MKKLLIIFLFYSLYAKEIIPSAIYTSVGFVSDFIVYENTLYVGNDMGAVDIFDIKTTKLVNQILLPPLTSSMNQIIPADILSVDYLNGKVLILSVGNDSYRNVWIYENYMLKQIINEDYKLTLKEARFVNDEQVVFATLDSDVILHDMREKYSVYKTHVSNSAMGDMTLSEDKTKMIMADESGAVKIIDIKSSDTIKTHYSQNVDNIYKVAYSNGVILTAGQDRRVGVYQNTQEPYYIKSDFLVFCVGISPSGEVGVYSSGEENVLQLFNTKTKTKYDRLVGHTKIINQIKFISEKEIFSSSRDNKILYWELN